MCYQVRTLARFEGRNGDFSLKSAGILAKLALGAISVAVAATHGLESGDTDVRHIAKLFGEAGGCYLSIVERIPAVDLAHALLLPGYVGASSAKVTERILSTWNWLCISSGACVKSDGKNDTTKCRLHREILFLPVRHLVMLARVPSAQMLHFSP